VPNPAGMTERQQKWFATAIEGLARQTGKTVEQWAEVARACPEAAHRKRLAWLKQHHGLGMNHASIVLETAFPPEGALATPEGVFDALWSDPQARAICEAIKVMAAALPDVIVGQRKGYTPFSRGFQFAAARPRKQLVLLGLAVEPSADPRLVPARNEGWSERLHSTLTLRDVSEVDATVEGLLRQAWDGA
jgi:hypothetical protein